MVTIIGTPISHYVQTAILTCEEKNAPYRLQVAGHDTPAALQSPAHQRWHPFCRIPAVAVAGVQLYETSAICRYIDQVFAGTSLVPEQPLAAARMEQWISAINCYFHTPCISQLVSQYVFPRGPGGQPDKQVIAAAMPKIERAMAQLAETYHGSNYLAGDQLSLADLFIAPILMQMDQTPEGRACLGRFPAIKEKLKLILLRPSFQRALSLYNDSLPAGNCLLF